MGQKIVSMLHYAAPPVIGGVESTIFQHAKLLDKIGFQVQVLAGRGGKFHAQIGFIHIDLLDSRHPEIIEIGKQLANGHISSEFYRLRDQIKSKLAASLAKSNIIIVHNVITLHKNLAFTAALYEFAQSGMPLIAWCHDFAWQDELYQPSLHNGYPWELLATPWPSTQYVAVSQSRQAKLSRLLGIGSSAIEVISPGIDPIQFFGISPSIDQLINELNLLQRNPVALLPARITRRKNIEFAIEVMGALKDIFPNSCLIITGPPGPHNPSNQAYLNHLKERRSALNLDQHVTFLYELGNERHPLQVTDQMIAELYRIADLLIFPSKREGFGIPILEAGLSRLPVFAADIPPIRESSDGNVNFFNPANQAPSAVAKQIAEYLHSNQEFLLRKRVLSTYTWQEIVVQKILPLIKKIAHNDPKEKKGQ